MWSRKHCKCVICGGTNFKHMAKGRCSSCYAKEYKSDPAVNAKINRQKKEWYERYHADIMLKLAAYRDHKHFGGLREQVLVRDNYQCRTCQSTQDLIVHHIDGNGRGKKRPNNTLDNLITLCRSCHVKEHVVEMLQIREAKRKRNKKT